MTAGARAASGLRPRLQHPLWRSRLSCLRLQTHASRAARTYRPRQRAHTHLGAPPRPRRPPAQGTAQPGSSIDTAEVSLPPAAWSTSYINAGEGRQPPRRGERRAGGGQRTLAPRNTTDSAQQGLSAQYETQARLARVEMERAAPRDGPALPPRTSADAAAHPRLHSARGGHLPHLLFQELSVGRLRLRRRGRAASLPATILEVLAARPAPHPLLHPA